MRLQPLFTLQEFNFVLSTITKYKSGFQYERQFNKRVNYFKKQGRLHLRRLVNNNLTDNTN